MSQDPFNDMMAAWKKLNDEFLSSWGKAFEGFAATREGEAAAQEAQKSYVAMRNAMNEAARTTYGPIIEAVGAVPLTEFHRLADQVHTILLRLDRIDDALRELAAAEQPAEKPPKKRKKK